ncbi:hypothetical protein [Pseudoalteromonas piscicida]|uniref:Uncharacterized protein n=1 Tax=Pseudoalteromonas piscicida TaxID=43662 RepID=A0A2A5JTS2_PSEO7|nr:hypothetical protein [Pseudoalteromonas piscicida]PCK32766.1 hypothetical protein CEX98_05025 [Pseudoalteromonas piscicida]
MRFVLVFTFFLVSFQASATFQASTITKIKHIESYSSYGNGDVVFTVTTPQRVCTGGYWLKKDDAGFEANLSILLSAYHGSSDVQIRGLVNELWGGSSKEFCHIHSIKVISPSSF